MTPIVSIPDVIAFSEENPVTLLRLPLDVLPIIGSYLSYSKAGLLSATNKYFYFEFRLYIRLDFRKKLSQETQQIIDLAKQQFGLNKTINVLPAFQISLQTFGAIERHRKLTLFKDIILALAQEDYKMAEKYVACIPQVLKEEVIRSLFNYFMKISNHLSAQRAINLFPIEQQSDLTLQITKALIDLSTPRGARSRLDEALAVSYTISDKKIKAEALFCVATCLVDKSGHSDEVFAAIAIVENIPDAEKSVEHMTNFLHALFNQNYSPNMAKLVRETPKIELDSSINIDSQIIPSFNKVLQKKDVFSAFFALKHIQDPKNVIKYLFVFLSGIASQIPHMGMTEQDLLESTVDLSKKALDDLIVFLDTPSSLGEIINELENAPKALYTLCRILLKFRTCNKTKIYTELKSKLASTINAILRISNELKKQRLRTLSKIADHIITTYSDMTISGPYTLEHVIKALEARSPENDLPWVSEQLKIVIQTHLDVTEVNYLLEDKNNFKIFLKAAKMVDYAPGSLFLRKLVRNLAIQNRPEEAMEAIPLSTKSLTTKTILIIIKALIAQRKYKRVCEFLIESKKYEWVEASDNEFCGWGAVSDKKFPEDLYELLRDSLCKTGNFDEAKAIANAIHIPSIQQKTLKKLTRLEHLSRPSPNVLAFKHRVIR